MRGKSKTFIFVSSFLLFTFSVFLVLFLRWLLIAPFIFENILDLILLTFYGVLITIFILTKKRLLARLIIFPLTVLLFLINCWCLLAYSPVLNDAAICNGNIYYVSHFSPFGDMQWTEYRYTKWSGFFQYETWFFGYEYGPYKIICDHDQNEMHIIRDIYDPGILVYIDGDQGVQFAKYSGVRMKEHLYFLSEGFNTGVITYTLYACDLDYRACHPLPVQFTDSIRDYGYLKSDNRKGEVTLYTSEDKVIFTYGSFPQCYVESCEILEENNP